MKIVGVFIGVFLISLGCNASSPSPVAPGLLGGQVASGNGGASVSPVTGGMNGTVIVSGAGGGNVQSAGGSTAISGRSGGGGTGGTATIRDSGVGSDMTADATVDGSGDNPIQTGGTGTDQTSGSGGSGPMSAAANEPIIPEVTGDCPGFVSGPLSFQGLSGQIVAGQKGSGDGALLFYWHGTVSSAGEYFMTGANASRITSAGGIIFSINGPATGEAGGMCSGTFLFGDGVTWDILDQITGCAVRDHNINPRRIYATGCSAGGLQSGCMAARRSSYVAAVATNSGGAVIPMPLQDATRVPNAICAHGAPGVDVVGVDFSMTSATFENFIKSAGGFAVDCNHGGIHCGIPADCYTAAFDFLFDHPFGTKPSPYAGGLPASFPSYCQIQ